MTNYSSVSIEPTKLQPTSKFLVSNFESESEAIAAWGPDKYLYLTESKKEGDNGEGIDAYVLNRYGQVLEYYESVVTGDSGISVNHIAINAIDAGAAYFSYQSDVWNGQSSPALHISRINLEDFTTIDVFDQRIVNYTGSSFDLKDYHISNLYEEALYIGANFLNSDMANLVKLNLSDGSYENIVDLDYDIQGIARTPDSLAVIGVGHHSYWTGGEDDNLHIQFFSPSGIEITNEIFFNSDDRNQLALATLTDGSVVLVYGEHFKRELKGAIFSPQGEFLQEEISFPNGTYLSSPEVLSTFDGGFLVSFIYDDNGNYGNFHKDHVFVRYDYSGSMLQDTLVPIDDVYFSVNSVAVNQGGGVIGVADGASSVFDSQLFGAVGSDNLVGTDDSNKIFTFDGDDIIHSLGGDDFIDAGNGNNEIYGGAGADEIWLNAGVNIVDGGSGSDWVLFSSDVPIILDLSDSSSQSFGVFSAKLINVENVDSGNQPDTIFGSVDSNFIVTRAGNDTLHGGAGDDILDAGDGDDALLGGDGNDLLDGGTGNDILSGGDGVDTFIFYNTFGHDRIVDFEESGDILTFKDENGSFINHEDLVEFEDPIGNRVLGTSQGHSFVTLIGVSAIAEAVVISGSFEENQVLEVDTSGLYDAEGVGQFGYQWEADGVAIAGASESFLELDQTVVGKKISVSISYADGEGNLEAIKSRETDPILNVNDDPVGVILISGTPRQGENLSADVSGVVDADGINPATVEFQWLRDGEVIENATGHTYVVTSEDSGAALSFRYVYTDKFDTVETVASEDVVVGQEVFGSPQSDTLIGDLGPDIISALGASDTVSGGGGNDQIDGGEGFDTSVYYGNQSSYTVQLSSSGVTVIDRREYGDGEDELINVENLRFKDGDFNIDIRTGSADLPPEDFAAIVELYIAYFNRAPASKGLLYWADRLEDDMPLPKIAESFFVQPETQNTYAEYLDENGKLNDTEAFVKAVFNNVLGRDPYGPYWINELDNNPAITPAIFILAVLNGAKAPTGGAEDREYLANKTDIGIYFSAIKGLSDYDDTISVMSLFDGTEESVGAAVAAMDAIYEEALDPNAGDFLMPLVGVVDDPFAIM